MDSALFGYSLEDFQEEAKDLLARAEAALSGLKASPENMENINALFRAIHSLKGSAAYAGLKDVNSFAHLYESFLGELRNNKHDADEGTLKILIRSKDYLEDLVFAPESTDIYSIEELKGSSLEKLQTILAPGASPAPSPEKPAVAEMPKEETPPIVIRKEIPREEKKVTISSSDPTKMDQADVIKITIINGMKAYAASLKKSPIDIPTTMKVINKLHETITWAFGDEVDAVIKTFDEAREILSGEPDQNNIIELQKGFNRAKDILKNELASLDASKEKNVEVAETADKNKGEAAEGGPEMEAEGKLSADDIRGVSEDDIVKITLTKTLENLSALLEKEAPDYNDLRRIIDRLKNLNRWAFNEDETVSSSLTSLRDLLLRPYDEKAASDMKVRTSALKSLFNTLIGEREEERPAAEVRAPSAPASAKRFKMGRSIQGKPAATAGPTLRVRSEDLESLMETVGDLSGMEPAEMEKLQAQTLQLRMIPVGELFSRFKKVVRDLSEELDKDIYLEISGESVKLDKIIADKLQEPLLHMVRNAASHGLENREEMDRTGKERGTISLSAYQEGGQVVIEVSDNGRGISLEAVRKRGETLGLLKGDEDLDERGLLDLIFAPGFSTQEEADSVSGRGVGMDVVRDVIASLQGTITIDTEKGQGTTFRLVLPLTLAIIRALLLQESGSRIAIPAASVDRIIPMTDNDIRKNSFMDKNRLSLDLKDEGEVIPLVSLAAVFNRTSSGNKRCVVLVKAGKTHRIALVVDSALERRPLTVKPLDRFAGNRYFSSASIVDEDIVLILNVPSLMAA